MPLQLKITISKYYTPSGRCIQALDYTHKDKDGKAIKIDEKNYNKFKTKSGRLVYDGGGILPDFIVNENKQSNIAKLLEDEKVIFNFATKYYFNHPNTKNIAQITDSDFEDFKKYVKTQSEFKIETQSEKALLAFEEQVKKENINEQIQSRYQRCV